VSPAKTWKNHGLRPDLCEMLVGLKPSFVRFPGGCWVEGDDMAHMYHWKNTIGEFWHRQPLWNIWRYWATHGLGYHEYLQMCEDLGAEPLFVINVGMSHREVIPMDQMGQWVQDALDAIEYANGPTDSIWGGLRARNGHPEPFGLKYIEIGNENGGPPYQERYVLFHDAIRARYPKMTIIADQPTRQRPCDIVDEHYYSNPEFFMQQADRYDKYDRNGPKIYVGEYAVTLGCGQGNLRGAIGEAAFMTGLERNSDIVVMASYAPLFANINYKRWNPDLICFDSSRVYGLPSYYVQKMFAENRGDVVLPVAVTSPAMEQSSSEEGRGGAIGVGTWLTQAEFKDIKVTKDGQTLFSCDFIEGTKGWKLLRGDWKAQDGVLRQNSSADNVRAIAGDKSWTDYTYSLKARKLSGAEDSYPLRRRTRAASPGGTRRLGQRAPCHRNGRHCRQRRARPDRNGSLVRYPHRAQRPEHQVLSRRQAHPRRQFSIREIAVRLRQPDREDGRGHPEGRQHLGCRTAHGHQVQWRSRSEKSGPSHRVDLVQSDGREFADGPDQGGAGDKDRRGQRPQHPADARGQFRHHPAPAAGLTAFRHRPSPVSA
jgi:hypothetical protein